MTNGNNFAGFSNYDNSNNYSVQPFTNVYKVTSLEEAIMRTTQRNSDMVYFDQDKNLFYRVKVGMDGTKSWAPFAYTIPESQTPKYATDSDIQSLIERVTKLEKLLKPTEETNGKLNG